jgi:PAS domain S-box-containing protein
METLDIVNSTADAAYATDGKRKIVAWNKGAERLLAYRRRQVLGKRCYQVASWNRSIWQPLL